VINSRFGQILIILLGGIGGAIAGIFIAPNASVSGDIAISGCVLGGGIGAWLGASTLFSGLTRDPSVASVETGAAKAVQIAARAIGGILGMGIGAGIGLLLAVLALGS
jgi:hypothetical protein